jgi:hypothetical protein
MPEDEPDVAASIAELHVLLLGTDNIDGFLTELTVLAARTPGTNLSAGSP